MNYREHPQWSDRNDLLGESLLIWQLSWVGRRHWPNPSTVSGWGRVSVIGVLSGNEAQVVISDILRKWVSLNGITVSHREDFRAMNRFMTTHHITQ